MSVELVNLTPHALRIFDGDTVLLSLPASHSPARLEEHAVAVTPLCVSGTAVPIVQVTYTGQVHGLPGPEPGVVLVVSRPFAMAIQRPDLFFPFDEVREDGVIVGCRALARMADGPGLEVGVT